jgi:dihydrofolate reductase
MIISLIWAEDCNHLIGQHGGLPWRLAADMAWFRTQTMGKTIVMGRKTHDSIGRALPGRINLVQSRQSHLALPTGCAAITTVDEALLKAGNAAEMMVMGGADIYRLWLPFANRLYVTHINHIFEGDVYFPPVAWQTWQPVFEEFHPADTDYSYRFCIYEKS